MATPKKKPSSKAKQRRASAPTTSEDVGVELDMEDLQQDVKNARTAGNFFRFPESGKVRLRFLPYKDGDKTRLFLKRRYHYNPVPDAGMVPCLDDCPLCELRDAVDDEELGKHIRPRTTYVFNVVDIDDPEEKVQTYEAPKSVYEKVVAVVLNTEDFPDACSLSNGVNFIITRSGQGLQTKYEVMPAPKRTSIDPKGKVVNHHEREASRIERMPDLREMGRKVASDFDVLKECPF